MRPCLCGLTECPSGRERCHDVASSQRWSEDSLSKSLSDERFDVAHAVFCRIILKLIYSIHYACSVSLRGEVDSCWSACHTNLCSTVLLGNCYMGSIGCWVIEVVKTQTGISTRDGFLLNAVLAFMVPIGWTQLTLETFPLVPPAGWHVTLSDISTTGEQIAITKNRYTHINVHVWMNSNEPLVKVQTWRLLFLTYHPAAAPFF